MEKICIDSNPVAPNEQDVITMLMKLFGFKETRGMIDLTEGEVYTGHYCTCGEHFVVDEDDNGDTQVAYIKDRFADVPSIEEIEVLLKEVVVEREFEETKYLKAVNNYESLLKALNRLVNAIEADVDIAPDMPVLISYETNHDAIREAKEAIKQAEL